MTMLSLKVRRRRTRPALPFVALVLTATCASERPAINRVQPDALA
jgi:hypothetical protein